MTSAGAWFELHVGPSFQTDSLPFPSLDLKERERYVEFDVRAARKDLRRWGDRLKVRM